MISLVVPAILEVSETSLFDKWLIKVDFPTFGGPIIAISKPSFIDLISSKLSLSFLSTSIRFVTLFNTSISPKSWSAKSMPASKKAKIEMISDLHRSTFLETMPSNE